MPRKNKAKNKVIENKKDASKKIPLEILWPVTILFTLAFIFAFINVSNSVLYSYPANDFSDHLVQIKSTYEFGLEKNVTYWNNGNFIAGRVYGVSWYAAGAFFNHIFHNPRISFIVLQSTLYLLGFLGVYLYGRIKKYSISKILLFYALFFYSPIAVAYFLGLGSVGSLFGWSMMFFIIAILEYFKDKNIDWRFLAITPFYYITILSHMYMAIISSLIIGSYILQRIYSEYQELRSKRHRINENAKKLKIKGFIIAISSLLLSMLMSSFWWIDYINMFSLINRTPALPYHNLSYLLQIIPRGMIITFAVPTLFITAYILFRKKIEIREKILLLIPLIISILMLTRTISFIPILSRIGYENVCMLIYLYILSMIFDYSINLKGIFKKYVITFIILISISFGAFYVWIYYQPSYVNLNQSDRDAIAFIDKNAQNIDKLVIVYPWPQIGYPKKTDIPVHLVLNSYLTFKYNISTPQSVLWQAMDQDIYDNLLLLKKSVENKDCNNTAEKVKILKAEYIFIINIDCDKLYSCDKFVPIDRQENMCLLRIK